MSPSKSTPALAVVAAVMLMMSSLSSALDRETDLYPFGTQHGDVRMDVGDDISSNEVHLETPIAFYDDYYASLYVNLNGAISFDSDLRDYRSNLVLPFGVKVIAPFFADVDTRLSGNVYYRETGDASLRDKFADHVRLAFPEQDLFYPETLFIATWDDVGHYNRKYDKTNTFQVVIASDGRDSFVAFLYPEDGLTWLRGDGKTVPVKVDVPGQAGFDAGDNSRYYRLPGSGNPEVLQLSERSNVNVPGLWVFRVGDLSGANIEAPAGDDDLGGVEEAEVEEPETDRRESEYRPWVTERAPPPPPVAASSTSCARGGDRTCHANARCNDYPSAGGYCCECVAPFIGNGRECIRTDEAQRISGKVSGRVNGVTIDTVDLHAYVVTTDGRTYTAVSRIPVPVGFSLQGLYVIGSILGFLFALPQQPSARNGFMITGGQFNRTAVLQFTPTGETLTIRQTFHGQDAQGHMRMMTTIDGSVPEIDPESKVEVDDYQEEYRRVSPGILKSFTTHNFRADTDNYRFTLDQTIQYSECSYRPLTDDVIRVGVSRNFVVYAGTEQIVRFSQTNKVISTAGADPCRDARCDPNANCVPQRDTYQCVCRPGFEGTGQRCRDVDECTQTPGACDPNAECYNTQGSYDCRCFPGYTGDGRTCRADGQSCDILRNCDRNARCEFSEQTRAYSCQCNPGYTGNGYQCTMTVRPPQLQDCNTVAGLCDANAQCMFDRSTSRYACRCNRGWEGNGQTCRRSGGGFGQPDSFLIYTQGMYIMNVPFHPSTSNAGDQTLYIPGQTAVGIDVDCLSRYFYWTDVSGKTISRARLDGTDSEVLVRDLGSPEGVAVDWISRNIYWTDSGRDSIEVVRFDGTSRKSLFSNGLVNPRGIAADPVRGLIFWTDWNRDAPKIEKANMDGTDRRTLVSDGLGLPNGLTIDYDTQQVCWADAGTHKVECVNYDGRGRRTINQSAGYPFGLAFAEGNLYWTDWERQTIPNVNKLLAQTPNEDLSLPLGANGHLYGVAAVKSSCPSGNNPCAYNNGGCRFLCLPSSKGGRTCACPDDIDAEECNRISLL